MHTSFYVFPLCVTSWLLCQQVNNTVLNDHRHFYYSFCPAVHDREWQWKGSKGAASDCRERLCHFAQAGVGARNCIVWPASVLVQTRNVDGGIFRQFLCCWHRRIVGGQWLRAVLQKEVATPSWRQLQVFPTCISTCYDVILGARSGVVVKALHYKPAGRRFDS